MTPATIPPIEYGSHPAPSALYSAMSVVDHWPYRGWRYDGVVLCWARVENVPWYSKAAYRTLLKRGADLADPFTLSYVDEFLAPDEVEQLRLYLARVEPTLEVEVQPASLPLPYRSPDGIGYSGFSGLGIGSGLDLHMLYEYDDYPLTTAIGGYFDLEDGASRCRHPESSPTATPPKSGVDAILFGKS